MKKLIILTTLMLGLFVFANQAMAVLISGSQVYAASGWSATVFYDVWAPFDADGGLNPLGSIADYSYVYKIVNNPGSSALHTFTVGNPNGGFISGTGWISGNVPSLITITSGSTTYNWSTVPTEIKAGQNSRVYLTSPNEPFWVSGGLIDGGYTDSHPVPGPGVPEPTSMLLLGMGILGLFGFKRKA